MNYDDVRILDSLVYDMILSDYPRGLNRAKIADIANGVPPYTEEQVESNGIEVNYNDLTMTRRLHDARAQLANGLMKPGNFFKATTDMGVAHSRAKRSAIVTKEIGKLMKGSVGYYEYMRSKIGLLALHGISPGVWETEHRWCPRPIGVDDALIPSNTLLGFENLPFFMVRRSFTGVELQRLTQGPRVDPGWNMGMVKRILEWVDSQTVQLRSTNWAEIWAPEKVAERTKQDGGYYMGDQVPTIACFDIYAYVDDGKESGWIRRIILDSWGTPTAAGGGAYSLNRKDSEPFKTRNGTGGFEKDDFLFTSKGRTWGQSWQNLIALQYADLSAVAPFRYHSVRSLGFLLYSVCHLQNRLRCKFTESVMEALMPYFKISSMDDAQRALKLDLINRGFIDDTIKPVPASERWQVNAKLVELGIQQNDQLIQDSSSASSPANNYSQNGVEKTRFQVMAEMQQATSMIGTALNQAYKYQNFEYAEIFRRFCLKDSKDPDVLSFRARVIKQGVPESMLTPEAWDISAEQVMGGGNKTLEMQIVEQLMQWRPLLNPEGQQTVLRNGVLAITDNAALADQLVPEQPHISDSVHDAELAFAALMQGVKITPKPGMNPIDTAVTIIRQMADKVGEIMGNDQVGTPQDVQGLHLCEQYAAAFIGQLAQDEEQKTLVKKLSDNLGNLMNEVRGMAQRQQLAMKKAQQQGAQPGGDGKAAAEQATTQAKIQATVATAQTKQQIAKESHAQKTAQRQVQFEQQLQQSQIQHQAQLQKTDLEAASNIRRQEIDTHLGVADQHAQSEARVETHHKESEARVKAMAKAAAKKPKSKAKE